MHIRACPEHVRGKLEAVAGIVGAGPPTAERGTQTEFGLVGYALMIDQEDS